MRGVARALILVGFGFAFSSCGRLERLGEGQPEPTLTPPPVPPQFRPGGGGSSDAITRVTLEGGDEITPSAVEKIRARERDLVWTDPDNPESGLQGMEEVMAKSASRGPWLISFSEARRAAMREGKPLLIWFTDTRRSIMCRSLSAEVFSQQKFGSWAEKEVVRLRLDFNVEGVSRAGREAEEDRIRKEDYLESLKKRYKVRGLPTVLLMTPDGTVTSRYRGYQKTYGDFYISRLQNDVRTAGEHHEKWKESMARRGYREWEDKRGRTVFAKLARYKDGEMILVEPDGKRLKAQLSNLSSKDRAWIAAEKARRGH